MKKNIIALISGTVAALMIIGIGVVSPEDRRDPRIVNEFEIDDRRDPKVLDVDAYTDRRDPKTLNADLVTDRRDPKVLNKDDLI